jgi:hypothetical protein
MAAPEAVLEMPVGTHLHSGAGAAVVLVIQFETAATAKTAW